MKIIICFATILMCAVCVSSKAIFKVTLLLYEANEDKCCDGVNFFGTCSECDPYFTVCLRQPDTGKESCKDTSRENDKHSVNLAASGIAPTTFIMPIDTLEKPLQINIKTKDYDAANGDDDLDTLVYNFATNSTVNQLRVTLRGQNQKYNTRITAEISVTCEKGYHDSRCDSHCDNSTSSFCYENGTRVCLEGYTGSNCETKLEAPTSAVNTGLLNDVTATSQTSGDPTTEPARRTPSVIDKTTDIITADELTTQQSTSSKPTTCNNIADKKLTDVINASCDEFGWDIRVDLDVLRCFYPDIKASDIYLGKNLCHGVEDGAMLTFKQGLRDCLTSETTSGSQLIYNNELICAFPDPDHPFIIRHYNWTVGVECDVYRNETASGHMLHDAKGNTTQQVSSQTHYAVDMEFYKDSGYLTEIPGNPLHVLVGTFIYVKVFTPARGWPVKMVVKNCYTQTTNNATDETRFYLIRNGCEKDTNTHIISRTGHELKFVFEDFQYTSGCGLYLFCDAVFCSDSDTSSRCQQRCATTRRRVIDEEESSGFDVETIVKHILHSNS